MKRTLVIGDIHGAYKALLQVLERAKVTPEDKLIFLGDYVDGWDEVYEVVDKLVELSKTNECIFIKGNHDEWFIEWITFGMHSQHWLQGGEGTLNSYVAHAHRKVNVIPRNGGWNTNLTNVDLPHNHINFFKNLHNYYKDENKNLFVHGGFNRHYVLNEQPRGESTFYWDRDLFLQAMASNSGHQELKFYKEDLNNIYIGHTSVTNWDLDVPVFAGKVINIDTGAGFKGKLTCLDLDTHVYWQSDQVQDLYKGKKGRND